MVSEHDLPRQRVLGVIGLGSSACKIPSRFQSGSVELAPALEPHLLRQVPDPSDLRWRLGSAELALAVSVPAGDGWDRRLVKVPGSTPGKIPKPCSDLGKMTKSVVRNELEASELTAVRQVVRKANYKLDVVESQLEDLQNRMNRMEAVLQRLVNPQARILDQTVGRCAPKLRLTEEPRTLPNLNQPAELEVEMTRKLEDLRQIVATGWEHDQLPNVSVRRIEWENPKDPEEVIVEHDARLKVGTVVSKSEEVIDGLNGAVLEDFGIPSWLFGLSLPDAVERAKDAVYDNTGGGSFENPMADRPTQPSCTNWSLFKDKLQVGDKVRLRKLKNSCSPETMKITDGTIVGMEEDKKRPQVVRVWDPGTGRGASNFRTVEEMRGMQELESQGIVPDSEEESFSYSPEILSTANYDMPGYMELNLHHIFNALDEVVEKEGPIMLNPEFVMCDTTLHFEPLLTFSPDGFKIEYLDWDSCEDDEMMGLHWEISDIIGIGCKWTLSVGSGAETINSGPVRVQFCVTDLQWPSRQQKNWRLASRYQEIWNNITSDDFALENWSLIVTCYPGEVETFEDGELTSIISNAHVGNAYSSARTHLPDVLFTGGEDGAIRLLSVYDVFDDEDINSAATFDPVTDEFIINTPPNDGAIKWWIGNAAVHGNFVTVFARLILPLQGKGGDPADMGVHAIIVPIRNLETHAVLPGIGINDCGHKIGLNGVDNGALRFCAVRIPRNNLLNRFGDVARDGKYTSSLPTINKRFATTLGELVGERVGLAYSSVGVLKVAVTIVVRYALLRHQFGPPKQPEISVMEYQSHKHKLTPMLASPYAFHFARAYLVGKCSEMKKTNDEDVITDIHVLSSGLKAYITSYTAESISVCRELGGDHGYATVNRFGILRNDHDIFQTFEGDNTVLLQQVAGDLLKQYQEIAKSIIAENTTKYKIDSVEFESLTLGSLPPTFQGMKVYVTEEQELIMEPSLKWAANPNVTIVVRAYRLKATIQIVDLQVFASPRITLKPLVSTFPCFAKILVSLMEKPHVDFGLRLLGADVMAIPGLYGIVQEIIKKQVASMYLWPKTLEVAILDPSKASKKTVGILLVKVLRAQNLRKEDLLGKSDPYVKFKMPDDKLPSKKTTVKHNNLNPEWNEDFKIIVTDPETQALEIYVFGWEQVGKHEKKGMNRVLSKELPPEETKVATLNLLKTMDPNDIQNEKSCSQITLELTYNPFKEEDMEKEGIDGADTVEKASDGTLAGDGIFLEFYSRTYLRASMLLREG